MKNTNHIKHLIDITPNFCAVMYYDDVTNGASLTYLEFNGNKEASVINDDRFAVLCGIDTFNEALDKAIKEAQDIAKADGRKLMVY